MRKITSLPDCLCVTITLFLAISPPTRTAGLAPTTQPTIRVHLTDSAGKPLTTGNIHIRSNAGEWDFPIGPDGERLSASRRINRILTISISWPLSPASAQAGRNGISHPPSRNLPHRRK